MDRFRILLPAALIGCLWIDPAIAEDPSPAQEFRKHMWELRSLADEQGEIPLDRFGSGTIGTFAKGVCRAQSLAEQERYSDAASLLLSLITVKTAPDWRRMLETRIDILTKWAESETVGLGEYRRFYLETGPWWFHNRTRPIVTLWQIEQLPQIEKHFLLAALLRKKGDVKGQTLALLAIPQLPNVDDASSAKALLTVGNSSYRAGDLWNAEKAWLDARGVSRTTSAWPKAVFNLGIMEEKKRNYLQAIKYFEDVLEASPNDMEPGGNIMATYRNYSHRSALEISNCYEEMGEYRESLHHAWLAKNRYPYHSWCGTGRASANWATNKRIAYLTMRSYSMWISVAILAIIVVYGSRSHQLRKKVIDAWRGFSQSEKL